MNEQHFGGNLGVFVSLANSLLRIRELLKLPRLSDSITSSPRSGLLVSPPGTRGLAVACASC